MLLGTTAENVRAWSTHSVGRMIGFDDTINRKVTQKQTERRDESRKPFLMSCTPVFTLPPVFVSSLMHRRAPPAAQPARHTRACALHASLRGCTKRWWRQWRQGGHRCLSLHQSAIIVPPKACRCCCRPSGVGVFGRNSTGASTSRRDKPYEGLLRRVKSRAKQMNWAELMTHAYAPLRCPRWQGVLRQCCELPEPCLLLGAPQNTMCNVA